MIKCPDHPKYQGKRYPNVAIRQQSKTCWCHEIYLAVKEGYDLEWVTTSDGKEHLVEIACYHT
jgi:hypothetical protein